MLLNINNIRTIAQKGGFSAQKGDAYHNILIINSLPKKVVFLPKKVVLMTMLLIVNGLWKIAQKGDISAQKGSFNDYVIDS